ncbi:MAG: hypothetical protein M1816_003612 [Peltula sp. TS41687]|nr:MAG: hypothetical protein M1816_003612 [Peltula sp. TS41687]
MASFAISTMLRLTGSGPMPSPTPTSPSTVALPRVQLSPPSLPPWAFGWTGSTASTGERVGIGRSNLRFQELLLARLDSLESPYCPAHGQPAAVPQDDKPDDDGDVNDSGDGNRDRGGSGIAGAGAGGS